MNICKGKKKYGVGSIITIVALILVIYNLVLKKNNFRQISGIEVDEWSNHFQKTYFEGDVVKITPSIDDDKNIKSIYLRVKSIGNFKNIDSCTYLFQKNEIIHLSALNINITTGPDHEINVGDILKKNTNSDSIYVLSNVGIYKYYFPLFDGLGTKPLQMPTSGLRPMGTINPLY